MAPSTPPPPSREELAALTMASVISLVMSAGPWSSSALPFEKVRRAAKDIAVKNLIGCNGRWYRHYLAGGTPALQSSSIFFRQGFHSGQLLAFEKFQRGAASGWNVGDLVG